MLQNTFFPFHLWYCKTVSFSRVYLYNLESHIDIILLFSSACVWRVNYWKCVWNVRDLALLILYVVYLVELMAPYSWTQMDQLHRHIYQLYVIKIFLISNLGGRYWARKTQVDSYSWFEEASVVFNIPESIVHYNRECALLTVILPKYILGKCSICPDYNFWLIKDDWKKIFMDVIWRCASVFISPIKFDSSKWTKTSSWIYI